MHSIADGCVCRRISVHTIQHCHTTTRNIGRQILPS